MPVPRWGVLLTLLLLAGPASAGQSLQFDMAHSRFGFEIRTRFGQTIEGVFPNFDGQVMVLPDGRHQVRLRMYTRDVEIPGKPRYTGWMRGEEFFDAAQHPVVEFSSDPYDPDITRRGGKIDGTLSIRGISRRETLRLQEPECERPGYDCDLISRGTVQRGRYGMDSWQFALSDRVIFILRARLAGAPQL